MEFCNATSAQQAMFMQKFPHDACEMKMSLNLQKSCPAHLAHWELTCQHPWTSLSSMCKAESLPTDKSEFQVVFKNSITENSKWKIEWESRHHLDLIPIEIPLASIGQNEWTSQMGPEPVVKYAHSMQKQHMMRHESRLTVLPLSLSLALHESTDGT